MARASNVARARTMALGASPLAWFCAAQWPDFTPPLTYLQGTSIFDRFRDHMAGDAA